MNTNNLKIDEILNEFRVCQDFQRLEVLADLIGQEGDARAIPALFARLGDDRVKEYPDVEDAVCGALVKLGVMRKLGNLNFKLTDLATMDVEINRSLEKFRQWIPTKYFE
jgi:hypothetical protein